MAGASLQLQRLGLHSPGKTSVCLFSRPDCPLCLLSAAPFTSVLLPQLQLATGQRIAPGENRKNLNRSQKRKRILSHLQKNSKPFAVVETVFASTYFIFIVIHQPKCCLVEL